MAKKEIQVIVHYPENREACEQKIRETVAAWYAGVEESEPETAEVERLTALLKGQERDGIISLGEPFFASAEQ